MYTNIMVNKIVEFLPHLFATTVAFKKHKKKKRWASAVKKPDPLQPKQKKFLYHYYNRLYVLLLTKHTQTTTGFIINDK